MNELSPMVGAAMRIPRLRMETRMQSEIQHANLQTSIVNWLPDAVRAGLYAGVATGGLVLVPVLILQLARGVGVVAEMQLAASSVIGISAYDGALGFVLGTLLHFFVSIVPEIGRAHV